MPKLTKTGWEIGSSEAGAIVLMKTAFQTRDEVLRKHKLARAEVETVDTIKNQWALKRGNFLEPAISDMAEDRINEMCEVPCHMFEPDGAFKKEELGIASSIDRILELGSPLTLTNYDGSKITFSGTGICEIKSDAFHHGRPKTEWQIQVMHQMLCADLDWGMIAVFDQNFKLSFYPVERSSHLIGAMMDAYAEFWELVNADGEYPVILDEGPEYTDIADGHAQTNTDLSDLCADYMKASAEARAWTKTKDGIKEALVLALDAMQLTHVKVGDFKIKSEVVRKQKRKMVATDDFTETQTFSIKETS